MLTQNDQITSLLGYPEQFTHSPMTNIHTLDPGATGKFSFRVCLYAKMHTILIIHHDRRIGRFLANTDPASYKNIIIYDINSERIVTQSSLGHVIILYFMLQNLEYEI
jgi:hypothetical protein